MINSFIKQLCRVITIVSYLSCAISLVAIPRGVIWGLVYSAIILWAAVQYFQAFTGDKGKNKNKVYIVDILSVCVFMYEVYRNISIKVVLESRPTGQLSNRIPIRIEMEYIPLVIGILLLGALLTLYLQSKGCFISVQFKRYRTYIKYKFIYAFLRLLIPFHRDTQEALAGRILGLEPDELTLMMAAANYKADHKQKLHWIFPLVLRRHATLAHSWKYWDFNISLVSAERTQIGIDNAVKTLSVNLDDSHLAIINNAGKRFLQEYYRGKNVVINQIAKKVETIEKKQATASPDRLGRNFFFRWGSSGVVPIVQYKGEVWIMLVLREINPMGWNLPLGGSKNEDEKNRPAITAMREMLEEIIIIEYNGKKGSELPPPSDGVDTHSRMVITHPFLDRIEANTAFREEFSTFYKKQHAIMRDTYHIQFIEANEGSYVKCEDVETNMRVCVRHTKEGSPHTSAFANNMIFIVNPEEQGIECIKPIVMKIEKDCTLRMGEIDSSNDTWINNPMILIKYSVVADYFSQHPCIKTIKEANCIGDAVISELFSNSNNYELFNVNISEREQRIQDLKTKLKLDGLGVSEIENVPNKRPLKIWRKRWMRYRMGNELRYQMNIVNIMKNCFYTDENGHAKVNLKEPHNIAFKFCPTTWKTIQKLVKVFDPQKIDHYCNYRIGD